MTELMPREIDSLDPAPASSRALASSSVPSVRRKLGMTDLRVYPLAMGGNVFGWKAPRDTALEILDRYAELGGNFLDTADSYADGGSEAIIGEWMASRRNRGDVVIATKVGKGTAHPGVGSGAVVAAIEASLRRLDTDHIDLLYLHIDDEEVPFEETLVVLDEQVRAGKVRYVGASDHSGNRLIEARVIAAQLGLTPLSAVQSRYNLMHRTEFEGTLARVAAQQRLGVMPRFALDGGFLAGRFRSKADVVDDSRAADVREHLKRRGLRVLAVLDRIAAELSCAPATVAVAWLLTKPHVVAPVASASTQEQVPHLMAAGGVHLTRQQVAALDAVSA